MKKYLFDIARLYFWGSLAFLVFGLRHNFEQQTIVIGLVGLAVFCLILILVKAISILVDSKGKPMKYEDGCIIMNSTDKSMDFYLILSAIVFFVSQKLDNGNIFLVGFLALSIGYHLYKLLSFYLLKRRNSFIEITGELCDSKEQGRYFIPVYKYTYDGVNGTIEGIKRRFPPTKTYVKLYYDLREKHIYTDEFTHYGIRLIFFVLFACACWIVA